MGAVTRLHRPPVLSSNNLTFDAADESLGTRMSARSPQAIRISTTTVTIPTNVSSGTFYVIAVADDGNAVPESNETNNDRWTTVRIGADLYVPGSHSPPRGASSRTITVTDATRTPAEAPKKPRPPPSTCRRTRHSMLATRGSVPSQSVRWTGGRRAWLDVMVLPLVTPGTFYIITNADDGADVEETQENDLVRFTSIQIGPDLVSSVNRTDDCRRRRHNHGQRHHQELRRRDGGGVDDEVLPLIEHHARCRRRHARRGEMRAGNRRERIEPVRRASAGRRSHGRYYLCRGNRFAAVPESNELNSMVARSITIDP